MAIVHKQTELSTFPREGMRRRTRAKANPLKAFYRRITDLGDKPTDPRVVRYALMFGLPLIGSAVVLYGI